MTLFRLIKERIGDHPSIVALRDVYFEQPPYYVEEDYVPGQDLAGWCTAQGGAEKVPLETKLEIVAQIADALQAAHDAAVIHRDVKPGNILVSQAQTAGSKISAKLTDFGIGQVISAEALAGVTKAGFTQTMMDSRSSSQTGTHLYLAPELLAGKPASIRSDIYSLGVVLYQLLIGDLGQPLTGDWAEAIPDVLLRDDLKQCLAGKPEERFVGAGQLARTLRSYPERQRDRERRLDAERRARRKHRLLVMASGFSAVGVLVAIALGYGLRRAERNLQTARARLYAAEISLAYRAFEENNVVRPRFAGTASSQAGETGFAGMGMALPVEVLSKR
jgi:serine/threonine protein kinase